MMNPEYTAFLTDAAQIKTFITAGKAIFTAVSHVTGARYTFRVQMSDDGKVHFVSVLTGPDNTADYTFCGVLRDGSYNHSYKSSLSAKATSVLAFRWVWEHVKYGKPVPATDVHHEGRCGRCARALTVPESIKSGIGPECAKRSATALPVVAPIRRNADRVAAELDAERLAAENVVTDEERRWHLKHYGVPA